uniref:Protein tyrosine phosphatase receptor type Na n=1 Tax=Mastacembelus armatus TaxID=205130 RepID=A0A7N8YJZ2_9TELE
MVLAIHLLFPSSLCQQLLYQQGLFVHYHCNTLPGYNILCYGLFGQCRSSKQDQVQYQVSVPVLKRMQEVLKQLMQQGLSWQDDITQYILSKELKRVPQVSHPSKPNSSSSSSYLSQSKQHIPHHHSSKSGSTSPGGNYVDYMIVEPPQSQLHMQTASMDPYTYHQHRYQDEVERSLLGAGGGYARPSSRLQANQRERDRDRQLLQEALSVYLASAQPTYRHRGAASMAPLISSTCRNVLNWTIYGVDPRELTQEQLYKLALILQLLQAQDKTGTGLYTSSPSRRYVKTESNKPQKPGPVSGPPDGPPVSSSSASVSTTPSAKSASLPHSASQPPRAAPAEAEQGSKEQRPPLVESTGAKEEYGYIVTNQSVVGPALTFRIRQNEHNMTAAQVAAKADSEKNFLESETGLKIVQTGVGERTDARGLPQVARVSQGSNGTVITLVSMAVVGGVLVLAMAVACFKHYAQQVANGKLGLGPEGGAETHFDYQELCRQHMASKSSLCRQDCMVGVSGTMAGSAIGTGAGGRRGTDTSRVSSVSSQFSDGPQHSPSSTHSSTPSWSEEPAQSNMDISTGHMILAYMEDHLRNKDRLQKEWEALCSYQAEPSSVAVAQTPSNMDKNRHAESLPYDHSRVKLKTEANPNKQDYINASIIFDHDPRQPAYIATQGPLPHTVTDFWQMVWENGCTVIVMMTALVEDGEKQCERYWPDEGSSLYHIYEVNLVSEHIWCKDFLVRSFYLKNVQTQETRTLTQFHLLSWPAEGIPTSTRPLLDFRRKVNKCYRGRSCPIIVHCSDGTGRAGTYILIDMVLNRMAKGVKEIDIAATLEHIRDQRPGLVRTKDQFEFALTAVAEEVNAILKALPQ